MSKINDVINNPPFGHARFTTPKQFVCPVEITVSGSPATAFTWKPSFDITVLKAAFAVTTGVVGSSTAPAVDLLRNGVTHENASGAAITVTSGTAANSTVKSSDVAIDVDSDESISFRLKTQAVGSAAGKGFMIIDYVDRK